MKVRNRDRAIDISNIIINKTDYGTDIIIIINDKIHRINTRSIYSDIVLEQICSYLEEVEYDRTR